MGVVASKRKSPRPAAVKRADEGASSREILLEAALQAFSNHGFSGTSIRDISNALHVSVCNIYHYFGSKEGLWLAIVEYSVKTLPQRLDNSIRGIVDPLDRFEALIRGHLAVSNSYQRELRMILTEQDRLTAAGAEANRKIQRGVLNIYIRELEALRAAGHVKTQHLKILAFNILGTINWHLRWYSSEGRLSADDVHREIIDFVLHGLGGPG